MCILGKSILNRGNKCKDIEVKEGGNLGSRRTGVSVVKVE